MEQFQTDKGQIAATIVQASARAQRRFHVISAVQAASIAFLSAGILLYGPTIVKLVYDWWTNPDYSHGLAVLPLALGLVWHRRRELADLPAAPSALGLGLVVGSLLLLILGTLGAELFLTRASLLAFVAGTIVFLFGWRHLRLVGFPLLLLALTIPIPAIVISRLTLSLQFCASAMAEAILGLFRIPVLREGNVLVLPNATLQVAEACSGIRSMTALLTLALVVARFGSTRWVARALIIAAAIPIAVVVNGLRVAAAAVGARWFGAAAVEGAVHEALGWVMFLAAFGMMALVARLVNGASESVNGSGATVDGSAATLNGSAATLNGSAATLNGSAATLNGSAATLNGSARPSMGRVKTTPRRLLILTAAVLAAAVCLRASTAEERVPLQRPLANLPFTLGDWTAVSEQKFDAATVAVLRADDYVSRTYARAGRGEADLYVGYYETQRQGDTIHSPMNCLPAAGWQLLTIDRRSVDVAGRRIAVNRDTIQKGLDTRLVLYWYQSHGRAVASEYWTKAYLVLDGLRLHRTDGAMVRVIAPIRDGEAAAEQSAVAFVSALLPALDDHLPE